MFNELNISDALLGKTLTEVTGSVQGEEIIFTTDKGEKYKMYHQQDCCESVYITDIAGDLQDLVGHPILQADEKSGKNDHPDGHCESSTWTFYRLATIRGSVVIRWFGSSNGYYSETVDIEKL
jgi:hypothetical protein